MNSTRASRSGGFVICNLINANLSSNSNNVDYTSTKIIVNHVIFCVINAVLSVSTIGLNCITATAFWRSTQLRKKLAHFMIMVLSLNDIAVGLICSPFLVVILAREISMEKSSCFLNELQSFTLLLILGCSFKTLFVMNVERYLAIVHPIFHRTKVTKGRLLKCLIVLWHVNGLLIALTFFYRPDVLVPFLIVEVLLFIAALVFIYIKIYFASRRSSESFRSKDRTTCASPQGQDISQSEREDHLRNLRLVKSCFIVVICFCICFLPACFLNGISFPNAVITYMGIIWADTLLLLNSSLNSLIFFWRNKLLRKEAGRILKQVFCKT